MSITPSDPAVILAGIRQFGLAADGADLRDLEAAIDLLKAAADADLVTVIAENERLQGLLQRWMELGIYPLAPSSGCGHAAR